MKLPRRLLSCVVLACSFSVPAVYCMPALGAPAPAAPKPAPAPAAPADNATPPAEQPAAAEQPAPAEQTAPAPSAPADQATPPAAAGGATAPAAAADTDLRQTVENFWHYGKIAHYDLAKAWGQKIIEQKD